MRTPFAVKASTLRIHSVLPFGNNMSHTLVAHTQTANRAGKQAGRHTRIQWHYWWPATVLKSPRTKATGNKRRPSSDSRQPAGNWQQLQQLQSCQLRLVSVLKCHNCEFKRCSLRLPRRLLINSLTSWQSWSLSAVVAVLVPASPLPPHYATLNRLRKS